MSSTIFDSYADSYVPTPKTEYVDGDKKFIDLKVGDTLYAFSGTKHYTLTVTRSWHKHNGRFYVSCKNNENNKSQSLWFWSHDLNGHKASIMYFYSDCSLIIGTNIMSVYQKCHDRLTEKLVQLEKDVSYYAKMWDDLEIWASENL